MHLSWGQRAEHFTWSWFTMTMATGQMANVFAVVPYTFPGLYAIGVIVMLFNIVLFAFNVAMISWRFRRRPDAFRSSLTHPSESLYVAAAIISIGTILMNISQYGLPLPEDTSIRRPWLETTMTILFWMYCALAMITACGIYLIMWSTQTFGRTVSTTWIFPAYPLLVIGPHAAALSERLTSHEKALTIIVGAFTLQGVGFMLSMMVYAAFLYRLMMTKLPARETRPAMFISVGPSGFTVAAVTKMGIQIQRVIPDDWLGVGTLAGTITMVIGVWFGVWLWGLAVFFAIVSAGAHWDCIGKRKLPFSISWFSFVFPNTALTTATFAVGKGLKCKPIQVLGCVFTILLVFIWFFVFLATVRAVWCRKVLWPKDDGEEETDEKHTGDSPSSTQSGSQRHVEEGLRGVQNVDEDH